MIVPELVSLAPQTAASVIGRRLMISVLLSGTSLLWSSDPSVAYSSGDFSTTTGEAAPVVGLDADKNILRPCPRDTTNSNSNCVSSNALEPPNRYISAFQVSVDRDEAFRRAVRNLSEYAASTSSSRSSAALSLAEVNPSQYYIHLTVPGTSPGSLDDIELLFLQDDGVISVRCQARVPLPPAPFCFKKNCINGAQDQRDRVEQIAKILGYVNSSQQMQAAGAKWTPIFFNSDRVPDMMMDDEQDYK